MADKRWFQISLENDIARAIINDTRNRDCVTSSADDCILTFGRDRAFSVVCGPPGLPEQLSREFSRRQCQLFLEKNTLLIRDDSSGSTTKTCPRKIDSNLWKFSSTSTGILKQRALLEIRHWGLTVGPAEFLVEFFGKDRWWDRGIDERTALAARKLPFDSKVTLPAMGLPPTHYQTRIQTPQIPENKIRGLVTYHELEYLGKGSCGRMSRVIDLQWGGIMAVKIVTVQRKKEKETKEALKREVELLAKLSHGHYQGLYYLYRENIIHRDIKPENTLFKDLVTGPVFSLADFGLSKELDSKATFVGTPLCWSPEMCSAASQDFRVDIWSLGVVIYEMITGLALHQLPGLTYHTFASGEWCKRLEDACQDRGDLAKMVTIKVEKMITIDMCQALATFSRLAR
ncbi:uncharacterized protein BP5553_06283 [Venustampulla echinocandica]|uniref:Protein kinase domain-containing protein n=1 Tax=Venustampulla echinocandica TaxID=2656787 RepID=A0A370TJG7_9HELO|nr:uncharacterized protein BP5553_06283 [Venustampulla echinocandica]RDL35671.1 hypothetical protein BP5553_06283 [Venustampulla echinocandica]